MKKILLALAFIGCMFAVHAQEKPSTGDLYDGLTRPLTFNRVIPPYALEVTFSKTVHVIFPSAIRYVDLGSSDLLAAKADGTENVLRVKAALRDFSRESNLSVITEDGAYYSFNVKYADEPVKLSVEMADFLHDGEAVNRPNNALDIYLQELGCESPLLVKLIMQSIYKNDRREIKHIGCKRFRYYSPEMGIYISSDPIGLAGGFNTYAYVKDTNTWVDVLGLSGELVYQLIRDNKVVYYGITSRTALERMAEHGKTKVFDNMEILADGLTHDQARSIEGALIRQRLKERADDWSDFDSIKARLDKSGLDNRNRGRIKERWTSENPLDDLRDKIYKKPKKVKVGCKS